MPALTFLAEAALCTTTCAKTCRDCSFRSWTKSDPTGRRLPSVTRWTCSSRRPARLRTGVHHRTVVRTTRLGSARFGAIRAAAVQPPNLPCSSGHHAFHGGHIDLRRLRRSSQTRRDVGAQHFADRSAMISPSGPTTAMFGRRHPTGWTQYTAGQIPAIRADGMSRFNPARSDPCM